MTPCAGALTPCQEFSEHHLTVPATRSYIVVMKSLEFIWDSGKAKSNVKKHGVTFEEARSVFFDESAIEFYDEPSSEEEDRFLLLGLSSRYRRY